MKKNKGLSLERVCFLSQPQEWSRIMDLLKFTVKKVMSSCLGMGMLALVILLATEIASCFVAYPAL